MWTLKSLIRVKSFLLNRLRISLVILLFYALYEMQASLLVHFLGIFQFYSFKTSSFFTMFGTLFIILAALTLHESKSFILQELLLPPNENSVNICKQDGFEINSLELFFG